MRKVLIISLAVILFMSCAKTENIAVQGIKLNTADKGDSIALFFDLKAFNEGKAQTPNKTALYATIIPFNASNFHVTWTSGDPEIVKVETDEKANCILTPVKEGKTIVYVTTEEGNFSDTCTVHVFNREVRASRFNITPEEMILNINQDTTIVATILPEYASQKVEYVSSNPEIVSVLDKEKGKIIALNGGHATISVKAEASSNIKRCEIDVVSDFYVDEFNVNHGAGVKVGTTYWATVNCGYKAANEAAGDKGFPYGKLYQWGRKDGQAQDTYATVTVNSESEPSMKKPAKNTFYKLWDKVLTKKANQEAAVALWGGKDGVTKTEYDPCPLGWRVPTKKEMEELLENGGISKVKLQLGGNRDTLGTSASANEGNLGYYWTATSTADSLQRHAYVFGLNDYSKMHQLTPATGCSVRCVRIKK